MNRATAKLYLCLDVGGHAAKAALISATGERRAFARVALPAGERRAEEILAALEAAIAEVAGDLGGDLDALYSAGLAVSRSDLLCWSRMTGEALSPVIGWQDRRGAPFLEDLPLAPEPIAELTGLRLSPHYGASKLRWCLDNLPAVGEALVDGNLAWGPLGAYLIHRLTDERDYCLDPTLAQRTLLWDRHTGNWSSELAAAFGIPEFTLPRVVPSRHCYGHLRVLGRRVPLQLCVGDQNAVPYAAGKPQVDRMYLNLGSGAFLLRPMSRDTCPAGMLTSRLPLADATACEATVNGAAAAVDWLATEQGETVGPALLDRWLAAPVGDLLFLNAVGGLGSPWWLSDIEPHFWGSGDADSKGRAVLESVAFLLAENLERLDGVGSVPVHVSGGLAGHAGIIQLLADASGRELWHAGELEATLNGVAWLLGARRLPAVEAAQRVKPRSDADLARRRAAWREAMPAVPV